MWARNRARQTHRALIWMAAQVHTPLCRINEDIFRSLGVDTKAGLSCPKVQNRSLSRIDIISANGAWRPSEASEDAGTMFFRSTTPIASVLKTLDVSCAYTCCEFSIFCKLLGNQFQALGVSESWLDALPREDPDNLRGRPEPNRRTIQEGPARLHTKPARVPAPHRNSVFETVVIGEKIPSHIT